MGAGPMACTPHGGGGSALNGLPHRPQQRRQWAGDEAAFALHTGFWQAWHRGTRLALLDALWAAGWLSVAVAGMECGGDGLGFALLLLFGGGFPLQ